MHDNYKLDGKYSERVQLPAKAKFGVFLVANTGTNPSTIFLVIVVKDRQTNQHQ